MDNFLSQLPSTRGLTRPRSFAELVLQSVSPLVLFKFRSQKKVVLESCFGCFKNKIPNRIGFRFGFRLGFSGLVFWIWKQHEQLSFATSIHARANPPALVCKTWFAIGFVFGCGRVSPHVNESCLKKVVSIFPPLRDFTLSPWVHKRPSVLPRRRPLGSGGVEGCA